MSDLVPLTFIPRLDVARDRQQVKVCEGTSLEEMLVIALPALREEARADVRITVGDWVVPQENWRKVRPRAGAPVVIRVLPRGNSLRVVLSIAILVAAVALGQWYAPALAGVIGVSTATANAIIVSATVLAGTLLLNALIPVRTQQQSDKPTYQITGGRNALSPDSPVPVILGQIRLAPPYAALPFTEDVNDDNYFIGCYVVGYGPLQISDLKIGDTPIDEFQGIQYEVREGYPDDEPLTLFSQQVVEDVLQVQVTHDGGPVKRVSGGDASALSVSLRFPGGLVYMDKDGNPNYVTVPIKIRARLAGTPDWIDVTTLYITRKTTKEFRISHTWQPAVRGRYEIEISRLLIDTDESTNISSRCDLVAIRAFRPEYPINMPPGRPLALIAVRIKASRQLQGPLDSLTCEVTSIAPDWDADTQTWITRPTRNPASLARLLQQGPQTSFPRTDAEIDLDQLADWHAHCEAKGLAYDAAISADVKLRDTLADVCAAGRARPLDRGDRWGVVIDRPVSAVTAVISPRNARQMTWSPQYVRFPDGVRVTFLDRDNDFKQAERVIPWLGFEGVPDVTEEWPFPGLTDAGAIWIAVRRRMHELMLRPFPYSATQDFEALAVEPGDRVMLSHPMIDETAQAAVVKSVRGAALTLDTQVTMETGQTYRVRIRAADGSSRLADVITSPGETSLITLAAALDPPPAFGDLALFGRYGQEAVDAIVSRIEPGDDLSAVLTLLPHAPTLDELADAEVPPPWDGRAGGEVIDTRTPQKAQLLNVRSGYEIPDEAPGTVTFVGAPGATDPVPIATYDMRHRVSGAPAWTEVDDLSALMSVVYSAGAVIDLAVRALSRASIAGDWSDTVTYTVLPMTEPGPDITSFTVERLDTGLRRYSWTFADPPDEGAPERLGVVIRYRAGSWSDWSDLNQQLFTGLVYVSPYESSTPALDGEYTFGIQAFDANGHGGPTHLYVLTTKPTAPLSFSAIASGDDVVCAIDMAVNLDAGSARIFRSLASADPSTEIDVSGALAAPAGTTVDFTDVGALAGGAGPFRYRAYAENVGGVLSDPSTEAYP